MADLKKTKILIIGAGGIGERHLRCFQATGRADVSFCEPNDDRRQMLMKTYGCAGYADLDAAFRLHAYEAAVICTPASTHIPSAHNCAERGLHVLIEKPLSTSLQGAMELHRAFLAAKCIARVAYVYRSILSIQKGRELVTSGLVGPIRHVTVTSGQHFPSFRPDYKEIYYGKRSTGGGAIQDALTHPVHAIEWTIGPISEVACFAGRQVLDGVEVEDTANLICRHVSGSLSSLTINQFQSPNEATITYHGSAGSIRVNVMRQQVGTLMLGESKWEWIEVPQGERDMIFVGQANSFIDATERLPDELCNLEEAIQTLRVNLAALESSDTHKFVLI